MCYSRQLLASIALTFCARRITTGPNARDVIRKCYDFALSYASQDKDSYDIWQDYINFLKAGEVCFSFIFGHVFSAGGALLWTLVVGCMKAGPTRTAGNTISFLFVSLSMSRGVHVNSGCMRRTLCVWVPTLVTLRRTTLDGQGRQKRLVHRKMDENVASLLFRHSP